jgi:hypothetical protein
LRLFDFPGEPVEKRLRRHDGHANNVTLFERRAERGQRFQILLQARLPARVELGEVEQPGQAERDRFLVRGGCERVASD